MQALEALLSVISLLLLVYLQNFCFCPGWGGGEEEDSEVLIFSLIYDSELSGTACYLVLWDFRAPCT